MRDAKFHPVMDNYYDELIEHIRPTPGIMDDLKTIADIIMKMHSTFIVGNGGSAAIASHVAEDWTKICGCPTVTFNDIALMSCFANDYGWDNWVAESISRLGFARPDADYVGIFISSSGESENIIRGCRRANDLDLWTVTLTGFEKDNTLSKLGNYNIHVPSKNYNVVETCHESYLLGLCEYMKQNT